MSDHVVHPGWRALNSTERDILVALAHAGPGNARDLNERVNGRRSEAGTIRQNLYSLIENGYVRREDGHQQAKINHLTTEGVVLVKHGLLDAADAIQEGET